MAGDFWFPAHDLGYGGVGLPLIMLWWGGGGYTAGVKKTALPGDGTANRIADTFTAIGER